MSFQEAVKQVVEFGKQLKPDDRYYALFNDAKMAKLIEIYGEQPLLNAITGWEDSKYPTAHVEPTKVILGLDEMLGKRSGMHPQRMLDEGHTSGCYHTSGSGGKNW